MTGRVSRCLLAACALLALLAVPLAASRVAVDADLHAEVSAWIESEASDDGLAHMLLEAQASLQTADALAGSADDQSEADSEVDSETESESESETDRLFAKMLNKARAAVAAPKPVVAAKGAPVLAAKPSAPAPAAVLARPAVAAPQKPGLLGRMAAKVKAAGQSVVAGVQRAGAAVKGKLQAVLAKNPKLAKLGARIGEKLKSVSAGIKAKLKTALAKAKSPAERQKAILAAKKAAKQAKKAAIKVAAKAAAKAGAAGKKVGQAIKKGAKKAAGAVKRGAQKLSRAARKAARAARKAARKARRALRKKQPPRSSSNKPRDAQGRFVDRYKLPRHANGKLKSKKQLSKAERKAYRVHKKQSKLAHKALKKARKLAKIAKADHKFEKAKLPKLRLAARKAARKAAKEVRKIDRLRQQAAMGGPKAQAELAQAQIHAAKLQKAAIDAQAAFKAQKNKVKGLRAALKARRKAVRDAKANIHENGFDQLLDKVQADVAKLDKSLFGGKKGKGKGKASMKGYRLRRRSVEVPSPKYPGQWTRKDMMIVEKLPTRRVRVLRELEVADPSRPGFKVKKVVETWRKVRRNLPLATRPVTIVTKKEQRPFKGPDGKVIPVDVTYQVATQTVRAKSTGGTPAGFRQQEVRPPAESGLIYKEVTREFPALVNGAVRNLPFKVATWSKASIVLKTKDGKQVPTLSVKQVKDGAAPISVKPLRSAPRQVDGKWLVSVIKMVPVKTRRGLMLRPQAIDIPATDSIVAGGAPKFKIAPKPYVAPKQKLKVVLEGVDNSLAAQQSRRVALKAVEEDIQDNAINGSISERHLKMGENAHTEVDRVRENFFEHQDELALKQLIRPEHRFLD